MAQPLILPDCHHAVSFPVTVLFCSAEMAMKQMQLKARIRRMRIFVSPF